MVMIIYKNDLWDKVSHPTFTIITPIYNRRETIQRTIESVEKQTYRNIEYILIDDGSSEDSDKIIEGYMKSSKLPVMYIKKENGGVHTARNVGFKNARGKLLINIDSDDELLPLACERFINEWDSIPVEKRNRCWQIKALCETPNHMLCSEKFPNNINDMPINIAKDYFSLASGEQIGCRVTSILKTHLFPEPEYVKFVNECVVWVPLETEFLSWGLNEVVRVYHDEGDDRLTRGNRKNIQSCINALWNSCYSLNHSNIFIKSKKEYFRTMLRYCIMYRILKNRRPEVVRKYPIRGVRNKFLMYLVSVVAIPGTYIYKLKKM